MNIKNTIENTWKKTLNEIELEISKPNFETWFKKTFAFEKKEDTFVVGVPSEFNKEWLQTKFHKMILRIIKKYDPEIKKIEYIVKKKKEKEIKKGKREVIQKNTLPLQNLSINKNNNLNAKYTFDSFIVGPFNELAYSAAQAIIKKPGVYNPLFIYGSTGLGKTHLIQATGNKLYEMNDKLNIFYTNSEKFSQDYVNALTHNKINQFKNRYRNFDVFIMDDVQFFSGKEKLQEELFHLFNILYDKGKQIIFSSDKHPNYIIGLEDRLKSRFSAGMIVDITKPDYESRAALLKQKATERGIPISDEVIDFISQNITGNIRELEGILNTITIQTDLRNRKLSVLEVKNIIKNNVRPKKHIAVEEIVKIVSGFYGINPDDIFKKTRKKDIVHIRQIVMYLLREFFDISYPVIGKEIGGRDHTTAIHAYERIKDKLKEDPLLVQEIDQLKAILNV